MITKPSGISAIIVLAVVGCVSAPGQTRPGLDTTTFVVMGAIGFEDDYTKLKKKNAKGLSARGKLVLQVAWAAVIVALLLCLLLCWLRPLAPGTIACGACLAAVLLLSGAPREAPQALSSSSSSDRRPPCPGL